jgi:DNA-binding MarR family transcriptional regulator
LAVNRGLVVREPDPEDGRGTQIRLTPEGAETAERALRASSAAHDEMWSGVPAAAVQAAADALRAVFEATDAARRPDGPPARARRAETRS